MNKYSFYIRNGLWALVAATITGCAAHSRPAPVELPVLVAALEPGTPLATPQPTVSDKKNSDNFCHGTDGAAESAGGFELDNEIPISLCNSQFNLTLSARKVIIAPEACILDNYSQFLMVSKSPIQDTQAQIADDEDRRIHPCALGFWLLKREADIARALAYGGFKDQARAAETDVEETIIWSDDHQHDETSAGVYDDLLTNTRQMFREAIEGTGQETYQIYRELVRALTYYQMHESRPSENSKAAKPYSLQGNNYHIAQPGG